MYVLQCGLASAVSCERVHIPPNRTGPLRASMIYVWASHAAFSCRISFDTPHRRRDLHSTSHAWLFSLACCSQLSRSASTHECGPPPFCLSFIRGRQAGRLRATLRHLTCQVVRRSTAPGPVRPPQLSAAMPSTHARVGSAARALVGCARLSCPGLATCSALNKRPARLSSRLSPCHTRDPVACVVGASPAPSVMAVSWTATWYPSRLPRRGVRRGKRRRRVDILS